MRVSANAPALLARLAEPKDSPPLLSRTRVKSALAGVVETERDQRMHMSLADRAIGAVRTKPAAYSGYSDLVAAAQAAAPHRPAAPGRPAPIQAKAEGGPIFLKGLASSSSGGPSSVSGADGSRAIGRPSDPAEIEADRIADAAMSRSQGAGGCAACSQGAPGTTSPTPPAPSGQPLDPALQSFASDKLGGDFSDVRIHADAEAASAARALHARAYTVGQDVMFGEGQYSTGTASGLRLLLHELVHTKQDPSGQMRSTRSCRVTRCRLAASAARWTRPTLSSSQGFLPRR